MGFRFHRRVHVPPGQTSALYRPNMKWQVVGILRILDLCIKGTRITEYAVLEYLAGGMTEDELLSDFADLTREDIRAVLAFAAARERSLANSVA